MSRSIFEEVGHDARQQSAAPTPGKAEAEKRRNRRRISLWLLILAAMVIVQILVGGLTRLTDSGLSITEWNLATGTLPPMSDEAWLSEFEKYKGTTEFQEQNHQMALPEFKTIYWWEWGHRLWGRLIGAVFVIPFLWFLATKAIPTGWTRKLLFAGFLGGLQGAIGWWMVASGLVGRLDVSQHRLAVHLGLAFLILGVLLWQALSLRREEWDLLQARRRREKGLFAFASILLLALLAQVVMGAYVSGLDGGMIYPQWPLMGDGFYPSGEPFQPFEAPAAAQFTHRLVAYLLTLAAVAFWLRGRRSAARKTRLWANITLGVLLFQVLLGIMTVTHGAPLSLAILHQLGAILLFSVATHMAHQIAYPKEERIAG